MSKVTADTQTLRTVLQVVLQVMRSGHEIHRQGCERVLNRIYGFFTQQTYRRARPMSFHYERMRKMRGRDD